jgi:benzoyl-CoA reductase subunit A
MASPPPPFENIFVKDSATIESTHKTSKPDPYVIIQPSYPLSHSTILTAGIDIGSVSTQIVVMVEGILRGYVSLKTSVQHVNHLYEILTNLLNRCGYSTTQLAYTIATGYGRIRLAFADRTLTEIACHGRGAHLIGGSSIRTVLDMGGQDCKVIRIDEKGRVERFIMNDKCAAGTGRGLEIIAPLLDIPLEEIGTHSLLLDFDQRKAIPPLSAVCVIFARTEIIGRLRKGDTIPEVLSAYCDAISNQVIRLLRQVNVQPGLMVTGGIAKNEGIITRLEEKLGFPIQRSTVDSAIIGAYGAARMAYSYVKNKIKRVDPTRG